MGTSTANTQAPKLCNELTVPICPSLHQDKTPQIMPKASEQRCAMDSSDTWIREQLRQIRMSQCCVSEIAQLPLSLPQWWELKPWKQQSHRSKMLSLWQPLLLVSRMTDPSTAPFPHGWAAQCMWAARLDSAQGSSVLKHTNLHIHGYLLFTWVSDLCTQGNCSLCVLESWPWVCFC